MEQWGSIKNFDLYSISNYGRVKNNKTNYIKSQSIDGNGYAVVRGFANDGKLHNIRVHRAVAEAFIPNPLNKKEVNHIDYNPLNNNVSNLEWCSHSENMLHSSEHLKQALTGIKKSQSHKKSLIKRTIKNNKNHHIYKNKNSYMVRIMYNGKYIYKNFIKKEDAIKFRNKTLKWILENDESNFKIRNWIKYKAKENKVERNKDILEMRKNNCLYKEIGEKYGITGERARQIIDSMEAKK